jgi:hypothetical protein
VLPGKNVRIEPGWPRAVAEIEVIGAGIVEVDGLLHEAKAQDTRVEVEVAAGGARDGGDVVDAVVPHGMRP